jgi:Uma2 family endonuclease
MTVTQLITAEHLWNLPDSGGHNELVNGELRPMSPANPLHGKVAQRIAHRLSAFVEAHGLGDVFAAETGFIVARDPDTVLAPDVSFLLKSRIPAEGLPERFFPGPPDLAIEVLSPNDRQVEVEQKVLAFLAAGTQAVWIVNPRSKTVTVYAAGPKSTLLTAKDAVTGGALLPGFALAVAEIFE